MEVPFFTDGIAGCTAVFKDAEMLAFDPVSVSDLTGPETFAGIANVVVFVTSPFAFVLTPGLVGIDGEGDGDLIGVGVGTGVALTDGFWDGAMVGVGVALNDGLTDGEGEADAVAVSVVDPPPNPPPPKPPPPNPPPPPPPDGVVAVAEGDGDALGATVATTAAVTLKLPDSVENGLVPTPFVDAILAV